MKLMINGREIRVDVYQSLAMAQQAAAHAVKHLWIVLGDHGRYWLATPADCARLERAGYELA